MPQHYKSWYEEFLNPPDIEALRTWIRSDPEFLSSLDRDGDTPLRLCIDCGPVSFVRLCIERGANPNAPTDDCGYTDMLSAVERDGEDAVRIVRMLLAAGANVDGDQDYEYAEPPLIKACRFARFDLAEVLLDAGAKINLEHDDDTALIAATRHGYAEIVALLLAHNADMTIQPLCHPSVLALARESVHPERDRIIAMLVNAASGSD